jgi:hypothetical protein
MNAEQKQQLYGGEVSDYLTPVKILNKENVSSFDPTGDLTSIYKSQVQTKGAIDTKGLVSPNINLSSLIDQRLPDPMQNMLNQTLTRIAQEVGLEGETAVNTQTPELVLPKEQKLSDIQQAQNNIMAAMAELKAMGA